MLDLLHVRMNRGQAPLNLQPFAEVTLEYVSYFSLPPFLLDFSFSSILAPFVMAWKYEVILLGYLCIHCLNLVVGIVCVTIVGVEVVLPLQGVLGADASLPAGDGQVLQTKLPISTVKSGKEDSLSTVHVVIAFSNSIGLLQPE